jgi:Icc protein
MTGDLIQDDSAEAYERFRDLLLPLDLRIHCIPGNHDIRDLMSAVCCRPPFSYCAYEELRGWLIVGIDSCIRGHAGGEVSNDELDRLSETVSRSSAKHVMVCLHHPPVPVGSKWLDIHQEYDTEHDGVRIIGTPSTCRQFAPGSEKFAVDDNPPAYRRITLSADGSVDTEVVWVGE